MVRPGPFCACSMRGHVLCAVGSAPQIFSAGFDCRTLCLAAPLPRQEDGAHHETVQVPVWLWLLETACERAGLHIFRTWTKQPPPLSSPSVWACGFRARPLWASLCPGSLRSASAWPKAWQMCANGCSLLVRLLLPIFALTCSQGSISQVCRLQARPHSRKRNLRNSIADAYLWTVVLLMHEEPPCTHS